MAEGLTAIERPAAGEPQGALVLLHGRGADEHDLFPLLDALDPERRLAGYTPRGAPVAAAGRRALVPPRRDPDPRPGHVPPTFELATAWLDALPFEADRIVLGGFSQGAAMTYALGLGAGRPRPAALVCLSGFMPRVDGFELSLAGLAGYPVAIGHGSLDPVITVDWGREARQALEDAGADVLYRESPLPHTIDPAFVPELAALVRRALP